MTKARDFIDVVGPEAQASAKVTGVPASFTVAEALRSPKDAHDSAR